MKTFVLYIGAMGTVYLVAAIPFALIVGKLLYGVDLREKGSKNLGATNTYRTFGLRTALLVTALDMSKGAIALGISRWVISASGYDLEKPEVMVLLVCAVLGHTFSPFVHFRGGKGVAVAGGILLYIAPWVGLGLLLCLMTVAVITRYVSLGSITAALAFPVLMYFQYSQDRIVLAFAVGIGLYVIWKHRENISRLRTGTENKLKWFGW